MSNVPTNLIPTRISQLPEYVGSSTLGYMAYVLDGRTYKVQFSTIASVGAVPSSRVIATGNGLQGGGDLTQDRTISIISHGVGFAQLDFTGVVAGTYGGAATVPAFTVDDTGRVTAVTDTPIVLPNYVPSSRTVTAGAGLTGGGQLDNNITVSLDPSNATPQPLGAASAGTGLQAAREDHVHPAVDLTDTTETQGVLPLGRGGTGDALSPVVGAVIYADSDSLNQTVAGNAGQLFTSAGGSGAPFWQTLVAGTGITITQGSGTITIDASGGGSGTVTSVSGTGTVNGITLTGTVTSSGSLTLGGTLSGVDLTTQVTGTLPVASGGTGQTSYTNGQLLIGNSTGNTLSKATLTAGSGITITNGAGTITIDATGGGTGTVTSVGLSGGTTGLTATSSTTNPITSSGTFTLGGTLVVANGGTGATNATDARTNLVAAKSGANSDITSMTGVTGGITTPDFITFDTAPATVPTAVSSLFWDSADSIQTLNIIMPGGVTQQIGEEQYFRIKATAAITNGQCIMFTGSVGASGGLTGQPASGVADGQYIMGVATQDMALNDWGYVTQFGLVRNINTSGSSVSETWVDGDILYYNPAVAGGLTKVPPLAPTPKVVVCTVVYASASVGSLFVRVQSEPNLQNLSDVYAPSPISNGQLLIGDGPQSRWESATLTAGSGITITNGAGSITIDATGGGTGTVTSVSGTGTVNGITLTGTVTSSGSLTLGGTLSGVSLTTQVSGTLPVGNGGTGATTLTGVVIGNGASAFTTVTAPSGAIVGTTDTQTLTNKRITPRVSSTASISSPLAWNSDNFDQYAATAQSTAFTISADAGTPTDGQKAVFRILDNGTPRVITFTGGASKAFRPVGVTLTVSGSDFTYTTTANKTVYFGCVYNSAASRWDIVALSLEA